MLTTASVGKAVRESVEDLRLRVPAGTTRVRTDICRANILKRVADHSRSFSQRADVDNYLGLEYDVIGVEEATTLSLTKYRAITTCNRTSRADWRPRMYLTTNPGGVGHAWFKSEFIRPFRIGQETTTRFIPATVDDNPFVNREYRDILASLTGWQRRAWLYGDWDIAAGQFFTSWQHDVHVIEPFSIPASWPVWLALDYGWTHYTVILLFAQDHDGNVYVIDEHAERRWLVPRHAEALEQMLERNDVDRRRIRTFVAGADVFAARGIQDRTQAGTIADQWHRLGWPLTPANNDRVSGAAEIMRRLGDVDSDPPIEPTMWVFSRCARLIECIPTLEHDPHRPEDVLKINCDDDGNGGDDAYDALRYGVMAVATARRPLAQVQVSIRRR